MTDDLTPAQKAYALLWRAPLSTCRFTTEARQILLKSMTHAEQARAIAWVVEQYGSMLEAEMIAATWPGMFPWITFLSGEK